MDKSASEQNGHDCCDSDSKVVEKPSSSRKSSYLSGIVAGILACLCCCLPVVALAVGLATIQNVAWLQRYHTALEVVSWIIMILAVLFIWAKHRQSEVPMLKDKHFWNPLICMIIVYSGMTYLVQTYLAPAFPAVSGHQH